MLLALLRVRFRKLGGWTCLRELGWMLMRDVGWGSWQWKGMDDKLIRERVPTTGWLWMSSRGIQNTDFRLRRGGYVSWDLERLDRWGITEKKMMNWPDPKMIYTTQT